ncbi:hypothetical protein H5410_049164 [Solanum commersonii]|uniref:Peptidase A1 domain-containing protein n=1 Tax=Solanum commersonii TaxID=4109 RepID=A0A9J5XLS0_SOLCO|nr:hypothetical protein H5410_049164 [Solanum commersonii]
MVKFELGYVLLFILIIGTANGGIEGVIKVNYKFSGSERTLTALKAHDEKRHLRLLAGVDLPIGGTGRPDSVGLYYAKIGIGTPSNDYYVQVDTGSDIMWVNCVGCDQCPRRGYHGLELAFYNRKDSLSGKLISCGHQFCKDVNGGSVSGCYGNNSCYFNENYGDGSYSMGYFVEDVVQYDLVSGDLQTNSTNGTVIFGCGGTQSVDLRSSDDALDGVLGFGKSNSSMLSQLASSGKVKKMFAHCLDGVNGGGIFAIGNVVKPKVTMTPLVPNQQHYNVNMTAVEVGFQFLNLSAEVFTNGVNKGVIIDSGTTLAYLPEILSWQPDLRLRTVNDEYTCFGYSGSVDDGFPQVNFHFENSLSLRVRPHEYLFPFEDLFCIGWQNSGSLSRDKWNLTVFGGSSSIGLKDEITGSVHLVGAHSLSGASSVTAQMALLLVALLHYSLFNGQS